MTKSIRARATALALATTAAGLALPAGAAHAATTCSTGVWVASYYANTTFKGTPKKTACDTSINENYGTGDPAGVTLPKDNFGVRWNLARDFGSGGPFTLTAATRDGIRVYLDGTRRIDLWKDVTTTRTKTLNLTIPKGKHTLRVDFVAFKGSANVKFTYAPRTSASLDKTKPLAPTGIGATYTPSTGTVKLTWTRNAEMDLAGYRVFVRRPDSSVWMPVSGAKNLTGTSFSTYLAPTGQSAYYEVRAVDKAGNESPGSSDKRVTTVDLTPPPTPKPRVDGDDPLWGVSLIWDESEGATRYAVQRSASASGPFTQVGNYAGSGWTDPSAPFGQTSYYKVTATDTAGNTSVSPVLSHTRPLAVPRVWDTAVNPEDNGGISLTWRTAPQAPGEFRLYRRELISGGQYTERVRISCDVKPVGNQPPGINGYTCTDFSPVVGTIYDYVVTSVDPQGRESEPSQQSAMVMYLDGTPPPPVTGLTVTPTEYGIALEWQPSPAADIAHYVIHRTPEPIETGGAVGVVGPGTTRFVDVQLPDGEDYTYTVDAVDSSNNSIFTLYMNPRDKMPFVDVRELDLTPTVETPRDSPVRVTATWAETGDGVNLRWRWTSAVEGVTGYHVDRWNPGAARYERLTTEALAAEANTWTDTTAARGTTHFYRVSAVLQDGAESAPGGAYAVLAP
ncbi:PA14 domain-containing protein [Actinacidiphila glaucinigra]|uniref:PA14 domain-containing protein n=1 Tax=Actinacidiphila glaucinigra TaxID=235986 RepID=UPI00386F6A49